MQIPVIRTFLVAIVLLFASIQAALASEDVRKAANLLAISEALLIQSSLASERFGEPIEKLEWSAEFTDRQWTTNLFGVINGQESQIFLGGYAWGGENADGESDDITITFSGGGQMGGEPVFIHGHVTLPFNTEQADFTAMDFQHVTRLGENSFWGWVFGAEMIVGTVVGGGAAVAGSSFATGGMALGAAPWIFGGGAIAGSAGLASVSATAKTLIEGDEPDTDVEEPARPELPPEGERYELQSGDLLIALGPDSQLRGEYVAEQPNQLQASFSWEEGTASGQIIPLQ